MLKVLKQLSTVVLIATVFGMGCDQASQPNGQENNAAAVPPPSQPTSFALSHTAFFTGSCDGSGSVALDKDHFVVANDETSRLLIYQRHMPGPPVQTVSIRKALELKKDEEADLEGLARIGDHLFVVGSHARDREGKKEKTRRKLLGIHISEMENTIRLKPSGEVYEDLLDDLTDHPNFKNLDLKSHSKLPGDDTDGLNIEGLCRGKGNTLWLCFRGPLISAKALLIPITNPLDVIQGAKPRFGAYRLLDLQGRAIRGGAFFEDQTVLIADDASKKLAAVAYLWGTDDEKAIKLDLPELDSLDPESVIIYPDTGLQEIQILSDDGGRRLISKDCKDWKETSMKRFRSATWHWKAH